MDNQIIIIGSGISGATLAERFATNGKKVLIIEKRDHIGGNCYDYFNQAKILVPKYGPHFFHTNDQQVWQYISRFTDWHQYEHRVLSYADKKLVPIPVNITTVNLLFDLNIQTEAEMKLWLTKNTQLIKNPKNSKQLFLSRIGNKLYQKLFKNYTIKQWATDPKNISPAVAGRIPVHTNFDDRYYTDKYQTMPKNGYWKIFEEMLRHKNITILTKTDYFKIKNKFANFEKLFFTGKIDQFFDYRFGKLQYRSLSFREKTLDKKWFQSRAQINYPNDFKFTRITEPKHATFQKNSSTTIIYEYPSWGKEPFYPVLSKNNLEIYKKYQQQAQKLKKQGIFFLGRLGSYQYLNMDQAFKQALELFNKLNNNF